MTTEENRGRISGIGVGVGYIGSYIAVALGFLYDECNFTAPADFAGLFLAVAVSFLVLSIPCFLFVRERGIANPRPIFGWHVMRSQPRRNDSHAAIRREVSGAARFLVGRIFYTDAINTVIGFMALYTMHVSAATGLTPSEATTQKSLVMAVAITFAVPAGLVWGR